MFENLFKDADLEVEEKANHIIYGEILGDGMVIDEKKIVTKDLMDEMIDQDSSDTQNAIVIKTMRCQISDILGAQMTIDLLEQIEGAPSELYDQPIMKFIDYLWERHYNKALFFNLIYIFYPLILSTITMTANKELYENRVFGIILTIFLYTIEIYQMKIGGLQDYFTTIQNVFDFFGITSTMLFYALGDIAHPLLGLSLIMFGLIGSFYKGILSMGILSQRFRVLIMLL